MLTDLRFALRQFAKSPGFTFVAVLTLALGIGANTAFFSVLNNTLLRPLPYPNAERLVQLNELNARGRSSVSYLNFCDWTLQQDVFSHLALYNSDTARLKTADRVEQVSVALVSSEFFNVLGVTPTLGRAITARDDRDDAAPLAWLPHAVWQKYFSGASDIVGKSFLLDQREVVIAGVLPASFRFTRNFDVYLPIAPFAKQNFMTMRENHNGAVGLALLKPGVSLASAQVQMTTIAERLEREYPGANAGLGIVIEPWHERLAGNSRSSLVLLCCAVGTVLIIACVNLANMLLARSFSRSREIAIRTALGASRAQLIRQLLAESLLLSVTGGVGGLLLGLWGYELIGRLVPSNLQLLLGSGGRIDLRVIAFTGSVTLVTAVLFGLAPAWHLSKANPNDALKQTPRIVHTRWGRWHLRDLLVGIQIALALVLLVSAGLMIRSLQRVLDVDPGIRVENVLSLHVAPPSMAQFQQDPALLGRFYQQVLDAVQNLPGIQTAAIGSVLPFTRSNSYMTFYVEGRPMPKPAEFPTASNHSVTADYFKTLGIPLIRGRVFDGHEPVPNYPPGIPLTPENVNRIFQGMEVQAVISRSMAEKYWPGEDPVGKRFQLGFPHMRFPVAEIIGVVGDVTNSGLEKGYSPEYYLSQRQFSTPAFTHLILRTQRDPAAATASVRAALQKAVPDHPISDVRLMADRVADQTLGRRFNLRLFVFFSGSALLLALVGLYGVLAFVVGQRTREIGIRMALGAQRTDVLGNILRRGILLVLPGLAVGGVGAWVASRSLQSQLYAITPNDPLTYACAAALLLVAAIVACLIPALRATRVNPITALRTE